MIFDELNKEQIVGCFEVQVHVGHAQTPKVAQASHLSLAENEQNQSQLNTPHHCLQDEWVFDLLSRW